MKVQTPQEQGAEAIPLLTVDPTPSSGRLWAVTGDRKERDSFLLSVIPALEGAGHQPTWSCGLFFLQTSLPPGGPAAIWHSVQRKGWGGDTGRQGEFWEQPAV